MNLRVGALMGCLLLVAGCGGDPEPEATEPTAASDTSTATPPSRAETSADTSEPTAEPTDSSEPPTAEGPTIVADDSEYGAMLYDATGQAIYLFDVETTVEPRCYDDCAAAWPPVFTDGEAVAGAGVDAPLLGTTERADGRLQVTYNDHPLYFYAHEGKHEVLCHDVFLNGGNWYVVQPDGVPAPPG